MVYGGNPGTSTTDAVRLLVFDTSTSTGDVFLTDTEYTFLLGRTDTVDEAAAEAARTIAAKFSKDADKRVGRLRIELSQKSKAYLRLAERFDTAVAHASLTGVSPFLGGRSKSAKEAAEDDSDRVDTFFEREMWDIPGAADADASTST